MKKIFLTFLLILSLTLSTIIGVSAAPVYDDFDFTTYDNEKYDLVTGFSENDMNYSRTNKIHLDKILIDDEVVFSHDDFHHVLFFNEFNAYLGYVNTDKSDLELSTYLGGNVAVDGTLSIPDGVDKIALMNYNYDDTRDLVIYENEDIDNIAWDLLTYRDIFEGTDLIVNGDFDADVTGWAVIDGTATWDVGGYLKSYLTVADTEARVYTSNNITEDDHFFYITLDLYADANSDYFRVYNGLYYETMVSSGNLTIGWDSYSYILEGNATYNLIFKYISSVSRTWHGNYDNVKAYNMTDIFTTNLPDIDEFEVMKLYYDTYKDAVDEITYNDIYENNLLLNWDISSADNFVMTGGTEFSYNVAGDYLVFMPDSQWDRIYHIFPTENHHIYYIYSFILGWNDNVGLYLTNSTGNTPVASDFGTWEPLSTIRSTTAAGNISIGAVSTVVFAYIHVKEVRAYDLTSIFGYVEAEIDTDWIELYYLTWLDPLEDNYTNYYPAANLITLDIDFSWDDTAPADPDAITSIDEGLVKMGVLTDELKVFLAFTLMIVLAIFIGLKTHNSTFIILGESVLVIIFTMLGWFSFWILLLMALVFTLLILRAGLKGGNE